MPSIKLLRGAFYAGLAILAFACASSARADEPLPITIGIQADADWLLVEARTQHLFEKAGLKPNYVKFTAGAPMMAAAQSQSIDVAAVGLVPFLAGIGQGIPWVTLGITPIDPEAEGLVVRNDAGISDIAGLKGKKIGYFRASTAHYGLFTALRKHNVPIEQVTLLSMAPPQQLAAMRNKDIDAAEVWEPWMQKMVGEAGGRILATEASFGVHTADGTLAVRTDWLATHRETARRLIKGILLAEESLAKDPETAIKTFAEETGIDREMSAHIYKVAGPTDVKRLLDPQYQFSLVKDGPLEKELATLAEFLHREQVVPKLVDVSNVLDASVLREVLNAEPERK